MANSTEAQRSVPAMPERIASRYRVRRILGRGGFGAVFEAFDELAEHPVAVKLIHRESWIDPRVPDGLDSERDVTHNVDGSELVAQSFRDEFRLLTQLHHPNLATVFDFGRCTDNDALYFTQELVRGTDLRNFLSQGSREVIVELFVQLAGALDYIHALGLVHGDIKPLNILVMPGPGAMPQAKLIDFGLARVLRGAQVAHGDPLLEAEEITILGTPGFSPPERVQGQHFDARGDIYSLAATFYAAIRGRRAFAGRTFAEVLSEQLAWRPEMSGNLTERAGTVVAELVGRMLQPDLGKRPQSARSIVLELVRREASHLRLHDHSQSAEDRRGFARIFVEHVPFVDRAGYLTQLLSRAMSVMQSPTDSGTFHKTPRPVFVRAPEGMGKRRMMAELRREVQLRDGIFVEGSGWSGADSSLGPFAAIVAQLSTALGEGSPAIDRFTELVQYARRRRGDELLSGQLTEFLLACAVERPFVMHVGDLSRASEEMRTLVEQLCRAIDHSHAPILLCVTTEPHVQVARMLQTLSRDHVAEVWSLRPFSDREMAQVLRGILGDTGVVDQLVPLLSDLTGGHPLAFRETLRVLIEEGHLVRDADRWQLRSAATAAESLEAPMAERAQKRLDVLGFGAWDVAGILFLLELPLDESSLAQLSDLRAEAFAQMLDALEGEGLITRKAASGQSVVQLAHQAVREAVRTRYAERLDECRLDLAARIEDLPRDPKLVFLRARLIDDASPGIRSIPALREAADDLFAVKRPQMAAQVLDRLIYRLRRHGGRAGLDQLLHAQLMLLEQGFGALEDPRKEAAHYEAGVLVAELLGDHQAEARFWLGLADRYTYSLAVGNVQDTLERLDRAANAARLSHDRVLELRIAGRRAEVLMGAVEIETADRWSATALEILELGDASPVDKCEVLGTRLRCLSLVGKLDEARALHELAKPIAAQCPVAQRQGYLSGIAYLAALGQDPQLAIEETRAAIGELEQGNLPRLMLTPLHNLGELYLRAGDLESAESSFAEALRLASVYGFDCHVHLNRGFLGYVTARRGDERAGAAMLATARQGLDRNHGDHLAVQQIRLLDAEVAHMLGHSARARRELEEMLADFQATRELSLATWAREALARIEDAMRTPLVEVTELDSGDPEQSTVRTRPVSLPDA